MNFLDSFPIAIALAMDAFTVSIGGGASLNKPKSKDALWVAFYFGFFQFFMPILGWHGGMLFSGLINAYDHWIAFSLLLFIGGKMILDFFKQEESHFSLNHHLLLLLAIVTSIDALGVGLSYAFLNKPIFLTSILTGLVTFICSGLGLYLGKILKKLIKNKAELFGGVILIAIGIHILTQG